MLARTLLLSLSALMMTHPCAAQAVPQWREWNRDRAPFHIAGPLYYVGMGDITSLLITTPQGHILIDGGFAESAPFILAHVEKLGFKPADIRLLLCTHGHSDHAGGLAQLKAITKAKLCAGQGDVALLARGGRQDFAFGDANLFPPVTVDVPVKDGQELSLGGLTLRAVATPGHSRGCTAWTCTVQENGKSLHVVMIGGMSAPDYKLVNNPEYPQITRDFLSTFERLRALPCDIPLEGHGFFFGLEEKAAGRRSFIDPKGYQASIDRAEQAFRVQLQRQQDAGTKH